MKAFKKHCLHEERAAFFSIQHSRNNPFFYGNGLSITLLYIIRWAHLAAQRHIVMELKSHVLMYQF